METTHFLASSIDDASLQGDTKSVTIYDFLNSMQVFLENKNKINSSEIPAFNMLKRCIITDM